MAERAQRALRVLVAALALSSVARAAGDPVATLASALVGDPSYRVKVQAALTLGRMKSREPRAVQALIEALRDDSEAVRAVAAGSLGKIGESSATDALRTAASQDASAAVRASATRSLALLQRTNAVAASTGGAGTAKARFFLDVSPIEPGKADLAAARRVHDRLVTALERLPNVTLDGAATTRARFYLDASITNLAATTPDGDGKVRTDCDARLIVATLPDKSIKTMITVGGSIDGTAEPSDVAASKSACLGDVAQQFAEKVQTFLETQR